MCRQTSGLGRHTQPTLGRQAGGSQEDSGVRGVRATGPRGPQAPRTSDTVRDLSLGVFLVLSTHTNLFPELRNLK